MSGPGELPEVIESVRLRLQAVQPGSAPEINAAIHDSILELRPWMPWAANLPSLADTETFCRNARSGWEDRTELVIEIRSRADGRLLGMTGFHDIDWRVPRLEIGYWIRTSCAGLGYATESVRRLTEFAFNDLGARRLEIHMDTLNIGSWRVAERAGYRLEGVLRNHVRGPSGELRDTRVYARVRLANGEID